MLINRIPPIIFGGDIVPVKRRLPISTETVAVIKRIVITQDIFLFLY